MAEETILTENNSSKSEPQITNDDHAAFDSLADTVFNEGTPDTETSPEPAAEPVQKPVTPVANPEPKPGEAQKPDATVTETPEQKALKEKAKADVTAQPQTKPDEELDKIQPPKNLSPKSQEGWNNLRTLARQRGEEAAKLRAEMETLRPQIGKADPAVQEKLATLEQEVNRYKAVIQNETSPEFKERFDNKMIANETSALEILKRNGMPEATLEKIKAMGITKVSEDFWNKQILPNLGMKDKAALQDAILGNHKLTDERQKELDQIKAAPEAFQKKIQEEQTQNFVSYTKKMQDHVQLMTKDIPWCKVQEIPADATPEVKARLEKENQFYRDSEARFQAMLYPKDAPTRVETALAACLSFKLANDLEQMQAYARAQTEKAAQLQGEIDAIKKAGVTSRNGINVNPQAAKKGPDTSTMSDDDAVEAGLNALGV